MEVTYETLIGFAGFLGTIVVSVWRILSAIHSLKAELVSEINGLKVEVGKLKTITSKVTEDRERMIKVEQLGLAAHKRVDEWSDMVSKLRRSGT